MKKFLSAIFLTAFCGFLTHASEAELTASQVKNLLTQPHNAAIPMRVAENRTLQLTWHERTSKFTRKEGIRVFVGYSGTTLKGALSVNNKNEISGYIFDGNDEWTITTTDDILSFSHQDNSELSNCSFCHNEQEKASFSPKSNISAKANNDQQWSDQINEPLVYNSGILYVYRLALPVSYHMYVNKFSSDVAKVKEYWATSLALLNDLYVRELGVFFELVDDDRLIVTDPDYEWPTSTNSYYIMTQGTYATNKLIGEENYDVACGAAPCSDGQGGLTSMVAAYYKNWKGNCFITYGYGSIRIIGHELGHTIGGMHTYTTGGIKAGSTSHTEIGNGQSIMSYGAPMDFFALYNVHQIRRCQSYLPHLNYPERTDTIGLEKLRDVNYSNFVAGIQTDNNPPAIDASKLKKHYRIPRDTYFQFHIEATDPDGDELNYMAHQTNIDRSGNGVATYVCRRLQSDPTITFQPTFYWSSSDQKFKVTEYTEINPTKTGSFYFWLAATDGKTITDWEEFMEHPHAMGYDMYETQLEVVDGTPFKITSTIPNRSYCGEKIRLTWDVDKNIFSADSRVRILLSDDFGKTFKYVLKESVPNDGSCDVIFPNEPISAATVDNDSYLTVRAGVIKIEEIGGVAYALSAIYPYDEYGDSQMLTGGFMLMPSAIKFQNAPERYVIVDSESDVPQVANVTATLNGKTTDITFTETRDGNVITRVWTAKNPYSDTDTHYEQIIVINNPTTTAIPDVETDLSRINVYATSGMICIKGAENKSINIFDTTGKAMFHKHDSSDFETVALRAGLYIVIIDGKPYKIIIR